MKTQSHPIHLEEYNPEWQKWFLEEKHKLAANMKDLIIDIEHFGSTSIPGSQAKPIIDIVVGLKDEKNMKKIMDIMLTLGYEHQTIIHIPIPEREVFKRYMDINTGYQTHVVIHNKNFWKKHLLFRDYMRQHPEDVKMYNKLKKKLAHQFRHNRREYGLGKT